MTEQKMRFVGSLVSLKGVTVYHFGGLLASLDMSGGAESSECSFGQMATRRQELRASGNQCETL